jgi:flagellar hook protein FlgE
MVQINNTTLSALRAFERKFQVTANNIANVNTDGFKRSRVLLKDNYPAGVEAVINRVDTPGFLRSAEDGSPEMKESSNVELEGELVGLVLTKRDYQANINVLKLEEETIGTVLDLIAK